MLAARADRDDSNSELQNYLLAGNRLGAMSVGPQPDGDSPAELRPALGGHPALLAAVWDELARGARIAELVEHPPGPVARPRHPRDQPARADLVPRHRGLDRLR
jgi:hypothetical protein